MTRKIRIPRQRLLCGLSLCFLGIALLTISCDSEDFAYQHEFPNACWGIEDTLDVNISADGRGLMRLYLDMSKDYPYQNIYLKLFYTNAEGIDVDTLLNDTLLTPTGEFLVEPQGGKYRFAYAEGLDMGSTFEGKIIQYMREEDLCGIHGLGIAWESK